MSSIIFNKLERHRSVTREEIKFPLKGGNQNREARPGIDTDEEPPRKSRRKSVGARRAQSGLAAFGRGGEGAGGQLHVPEGAGGRAPSAFQERRRVGGLPDDNEDQNLDRINKRMTEMIAITEPPKTDNHRKAAVPTQRGTWKIAPPHSNYS